MSVNHYENFPVGSIVLPKYLRAPIHTIYHFARTADDCADEGDADTETRLAQLQQLKNELELIKGGIRPESILMQNLVDQVIRPFDLPLQPFYDLLSAFSQDVVQSRYENFAQLIDYSRRSANPIGRLILALYGETDKKSIAMSDGICTALQLINFWQDVAIDWQKDRIYLPQEDLLKFGVLESQLEQGPANINFQRLLSHECERAHKILLAGSPLGKILKGRMGIELRLIILGGQRILYNLEQNQYDIFNKRPILKTKDWWHILKHAVFFKRPKKQ